MTMLLPDIRNTNLLGALPKITTEMDIPAVTRGKRSSMFRQVINELVPGKATMLEFNSEPEREMGRNKVHTHAKAQGKKVRTMSDGCNLYVWLHEAA